MNYKLNKCISCNYNIWKIRITNCLFELIKLSNKPFIRIENTEIFSVLSIKGKSQYLQKNN